MIPPAMAPPLEWCFPEVVVPVVVTGDPVVPLTLPVVTDPVVVPVVTGAVVPVTLPVVPVVAGAVVPVVPVVTGAVVPVELDVALVVPVTFPVVPLVPVVTGPVVPVVLVAVAPVVDPVVPVVPVVPLLPPNEIDLKPIHVSSGSYSEAKNCTTLSFTMPIGVKGQDKVPSSEVQTLSTSPVAVDAILIVHGVTSK
jgi:signal-induced proliferation-associated 1 like protein 3